MDSWRPISWGGGDERRKEEVMEFLGEFDVRVPDGTSERSLRATPGRRSGDAL
jgi:hypothetical protein